MGHTLEKLLANKTLLSILSSIFLLALFTGSKIF